MMEVKLPKRQGVILQLVALAKQDFTLSKLAEDSGMHNMAVYHLQQSSEKIVKAYWVYAGFLPPTNKALSGLLHQPHELVDSEFGKKAMSVLNYQTTRLLRAGIPGATILLPLLGKLKAQARTYTPSEIKQIKSLPLNLTEEELNKTISNVWRTVEDVDDSVRRAAEEKVVLRMLRVFFKEIVESNVEMSLLGIRAWVFSMLSSITLAPHEARTRYPLPDENHDPIMHYSVSHPLMKCYGQLSEIVAEAILSMVILTHLVESS
jgi:HEPN domain-containing protein